MAHDPTTHHGDHSADAEYLPVPGSSYEHTDADVRSIVHFALWLAGIAVVTHFVIAGAFMGAISLSKETAEPRYPLASGQQATKPPAPQLQQYPDREMTAFRATDEGTLESYGWIDKAAGRVHIPIDEAIRLTLERGLPARAQDAAQGETPGSSQRIQAPAGCSNDDGSRRQHEQQDSGTRASTLRPSGGCRRVRVRRAGTPRCRSCRRADAEFPVWLQQRRERRPGVGAPGNPQRGELQAAAERTAAARRHLCRRERSNGSSRRLFRREEAGGAGVRVLPVPDAVHPGDERHLEFAPGPAV